MSDGTVAHELKDGETYQIDSDEYDSDDNAGDQLGDAEYDELVAEAENGFTDEEVAGLTAELKEKGLVNFLRDYLTAAVDPPPTLRKLLLGLGIIPPRHLRSRSTPDVQLLPYCKVALSRILRHRTKLLQYNTVDDAVELLRTARNIIVLSGAGISTSCGIPDFRSANGLYAQIREEGAYDLNDPQEMFDIRYFREQPEVFYSFAKQIYPSNFVPSPCHRWIKLLEDKSKLLRNYTQNIDTLETLAGVKNVLQCHGSFATASCLRCRIRVPGQAIEESIMRQEVPKCGRCEEERQRRIAYARSITSKGMAKGKEKGKGKGKGSWYGDDEDDEEEDDEWGGGEPGIMKPDITFFGQALDSQFDDCLFRDREKVDLLVIIGTSLKVAPVSEVCTHIPHSVPQIFINLTPVSHVQPDICLLGDADTIVTYLSRRLGWTIPPAPVYPARNTAVSLPTDDVEFVSGVGQLSHMHMLSCNTTLGTASTDHNSASTLVDAPPQEAPQPGIAPMPSSPVLERPAKRHRIEVET